MTDPSGRHPIPRSLRIAALALGATLPAAAWALTAADLPQLIALDDRPVAELAAPELEWSPDGAHLVASGYAAAGQPVVVVAPVDGRPAFSIPNLASPRLAPAPFGSQIACWQHAAPGPAGESRFVLSVFDPLLGVCAPLPGLAPFETAPPIVWLADPQRIVTLRQQGGSTALVIYDPRAGQLAPLVATVAGLGTVLRASSVTGSVIVGTVGADGQTEYYLIDADTGIASNVPEGEEPRALEQAAPGGAGVSPLSGLAAACRDDGLWVAEAGAKEARRVLPRGELGAHRFLGALPPVWSPSEEHIAYAIKAPGATTFEARIATLGLEEIVCELFYAGGDSPPALGTTVWICMDLQLDDRGRVLEPKWATLKAQLEVTSSPLVEANGQTIRARNVGLGAGVLQRLTGISDPPADMEDERSLRIGPAGTTPRTVLRSFTLPARQGLIAWSEGASTGSVLRAHVTRKSLLLVGSPAPE